MRCSVSLIVFVNLNRAQGLRLSFSPEFCVQVIGYLIADHFWERQAEGEYQPILKENTE